MDKIKIFFSKHNYSPRLRSTKQWNSGVNVVGALQFNQHFDKIASKNHFHFGIVDRFGHKYHYGGNYYDHRFHNSANGTILLYSMLGAAANASKKDDNANAIANDNNDNIIDSNKCM